MSERKLAFRRIVIPRGFWKLLLTVAGLTLYAYVLHAVSTSRRVRSQGNVGRSSGAHAPDNLQVQGLLPGKALVVDGRTPGRPLGIQALINDTVLPLIEVAVPKRPPAVEGLFPAKLLSESTRNLPVKRKNMENCNHVYGKVTVFVAVEPVNYKTHYKVALDSLRCYIASTDYELKIVDVFLDPRVAEKCSQYYGIFFRKHCAAAVYLEDTDWLLVLDADTGIVNPNHCIEEYIDDRVEMIFYERYFNWEIVSGNYLVKNSAFSKDFLMRWANYEHLELGHFWWKGFDNGGTRIWPGKLKLLRRAHGFCRDWTSSFGTWCQKDFMFHGWKAHHVGENGWSSPFKKDFDLAKCGPNYDGWSWRPESRVNTTTVQAFLATTEKQYSAYLPTKHVVLPFLAYPDIALCYPDCDVLERVPGQN